MRSLPQTYYQHLVIPSELTLSALPSDIPLDEPILDSLYAPSIPTSGLSQYLQQTPHLINHQKTIPQVLKNPQHLKFHQKSLPQFYILDQEHLQVDNSHDFHIHALLIFLQNNPPLQLTFHQRSLPQFQIMNQETLSAMNTKVLHLKYH